jgi:hypothetical protein
MADPVPEHSTPQSVDSHSEVVDSFRRVLALKRVILTMAAYGSLATLDSAFGALQPLFFTIHIHNGAPGVSPAQIDLLLGIFSVLNDALQGLLFSPVVGSAGLQRTSVHSFDGYVCSYPRPFARNELGCAEDRSQPTNLLGLSSCYVYSWSCLTLG